MALAVASGFISIQFGMDFNDFHRILEMLALFFLLPWNVTSFQRRIVYFIFHLCFNLCWFGEKCAVCFKKRRKKQAAIWWCFALRNYVVFLWIVFNFDDTKDAADEIKREKKDEHEHISMTSLQIYKVKIHGVSWRFALFCVLGWKLREKFNRTKSVNLTELSRVAIFISKR